MERFFIFIAILAIPLSSCDMLPAENDGEGIIVLSLRPAEPERHTKSKTRKTVNMRRKWKKAARSHWNSSTLPV